MQPVKGSTLHVNRRLRRIQVFGLLIGVDRASSEGDHRTGLSANRNHQAIPESIDDAPVVALDDEAAAEQKAFRKSLREQVLPETLAQGGRVSQAERFNCRRREAAVCKLVANPRIRPGKLRAEPGGGSLVDLQERLALRRIGALRIGGLHLRQRKPEPLGEQLDRVLEPDLLVQLEELEYVAANPASVAVEEALVAVDMERRRLLRVKRAETFVAGPRFLQRHVVLNDGDDIRLGLQVVDERLGEQSH